MRVVRSLHWPQRHWPFGGKPRIAERGREGEELAALGTESRGVYVPGGGGGGGGGGGVYTVPRWAERGRALAASCGANKPVSG